LYDKHVSYSNRTRIIINNELETSYDNKSSSKDEIRLENEKDENCSAGSCDEKLRCKISLFNQNKIVFSRGNFIVSDVPIN